MGRMPNWTKQETQYLEDEWGQTSISAIAKKLGRSVNAVKLKAQRCGLRRHLHAGENPTLEQVWAAIGIQGSTGYNTKRFIALGMPVHRHRVVNSSFRVVKISEFWKWAEKHQRLFDFRNFEENALGAEPEWAKQKRVEDIRNFKRPHNCKWSSSDDAALRAALKTYRYTYSDLSIRLNRSEGAIKRRIFDLRLRERPVRVECRLWTNDEVCVLLRLWAKGYSYERIAAELGRTALQVRGKHERLRNPEMSKRAYRRWAEKEKQKGVK